MFKRSKKFENRNVHLLFRLEGKLKSKHETDTDESIILALVYEGDCGKLK
jgi:hypothetical protein